MKNSIAATSWLMLLLCLCGVDFLGVSGPKLVSPAFAAFPVVDVPVIPALTLESSTTFGGAGDETGTGIAVDSTGVYFSGSGNGGAQGVMGQFDLSLGALPVWSRSWPDPSDSSLFNGVALTSTGIIASGYSYTQTVDSVGGKEIKGITVKFNADGSAGGGVGSSVWSRQTPAAPGGFPYGGIEWLTGVVTASEAGQRKVYVAGLGQDSRFFNLGFGTIGRFVTKLDDAGNILWTRTDDATIVAAPSSPLWNTRTTGLAATGDGLYVASRNETSGVVHPDLKKYDANGNLQWSRTSGASGEYRGTTSAGGNVYAVGQTNPESANPDFLIESWDGAGNLLWSKTYARTLTQDTLNGVVFYDGRLFAVGSTGDNAGSKDGVVLELDSVTGDVLSITLWGGVADDEFTGVAVNDGKLYAVGSTKSLGAGGSDIALAVFKLSSQTPVNLPPVANAGAAQAVRVGATVVLNGSASSDPDGDPLTFSWQILNKPAGSTATLVGATTATPSFVADLAGSYVVKFTVTDPSGASSSAAVKVTANTNRPPVAVIAPVFGKLDAPAEKVLDGRGSSDPDGDTISFKWRLASKPAASKKGVLIGVTRSTPTLYMDVVGDYVVELTVWDTKELRGTTQRTITALGAGSPQIPPQPPDPVHCMIKTGFLPGSIFIVQYVECNGKQISPYAYNSGPVGLANEYIEPIPGTGQVGLTGDQSVAYWIYKTVSTAGLSPTRTTYEANCTRNPQTTPVAITGTAQQDYGPGSNTEIRDLKINGLVATSKLCDLGTNNCTNYTKLLPSGCSAR